MEEDIILALNEDLQNTEEPTLIWFYKVKYLELGAISSFLTKKARAEDLLNVRKSIFIWIVKIVDPTVIGIEILEY